MVAHLIRAKALHMGSRDVMLRPKGAALHQFKPESIPAFVNHPDFCNTQKFETRDGLLPAAHVKTTEPEAYASHDL